MKQTITLYADEGMILTDGKDFGTIIHLAEGVDKNQYREITLVEYDSITVKNNDTLGDEII